MGGPDNATLTTSVFIYNQAFSGSYMYNRAAAASMIMFVIICIVSFKGGMFTADFWGRVANNLSKGTTTGGLWPQMKGTLMTLIWVFIGVEGASVMGSRVKSLNEAQQATIAWFRPAFGLLHDDFNPAMRLTYPGPIGQRCTTSFG